MGEEEPWIQWDRQRVAAVSVAGLSVIVTLPVTLNGEIALWQACRLLFPLAVIFWPVSMDEHYRVGMRGFSHSRGERPPAFMIQLVGWIVLLFLVIWPFLMMIWVSSA